MSSVLASFVNWRWKATRLIDQPGVDPQLVRQAAQRVYSQTGVNLMDPSTANDAMRTAQRQAFRQVLRAVLGCIPGTAALVCLVLSVVPGNASIGLRVSFGVVGLVLAVIAVWVWLPALRPTPAYVARQAVWRRLYEELSAAIAAPPRPGGDGGPIVGQH